jgi:hypothetical protein
VGMGGLFHSFNGWASGGDVGPGNRFIACL